MKSLQELVKENGDKIVYFQNCKEDKKYNDYVIELGDE